MYDNNVINNFYETNEKNLQKLEEEKAALVHASYDLSKRYEAETDPEAKKRIDAEWAAMETRVALHDIVIAATSDILQQVNQMREPERTRAQQEPTPVNMERMKHSKSLDNLMGRIQTAADAREKFKAASVHGDRKEVKKAKKEEKRAQRKISMVRNPEMLRERDRLAQELVRMSQVYHTANSEEYQVRLEQLKELDRLIFGRRAKKIYKDFKKPVNMLGGTYLELPKQFLEMKLEGLGNTR